MPSIRERGSIWEPVMILIFLSLIIFVLVIPSKGPTPPRAFPSINTDTNTYISYPTGYGSGSGEPSSTYSPNIYLQLGNASYSEDPSQEYVSLYNSGQTGVDITGWTLENAKDTRTVVISGNTQNYPRDSRTIPRGVLSISSYPHLTDIVLQPGESAIVTSGKISNSYPYKIISFKENECSGYLETSGNYTFTPSLYPKCVSPNKEVGYENLEANCQDLIDSLSSCREPKLNEVDIQGNICNSCVNGTPVSTECFAFIKAHYSYESCLANHQNDPNFSLKEWRIFLNSDWQMWNNKRETISLYDSLHRLVNSISY
ncbi:lamin tail domain-containing protein [Candidatus Parcubacteria bacterium]|nr:lamin tail domain-containing protein [Candidatus Parcubacteria bacterium]